MKISMVIPTYWTEKENLVFDHPTHLSENGTLAKTIQSLYSLEDTEFDLYIVACSADTHVEKKVEQKVEEIITNTKCPVKIHLFSHSDLKKVNAELKKKGITSPLSLDGYSDIRNVCIAIPLLYGSDTVVLIDDDELIPQQNYISLIRETLPGNYGFAGYYLQNGTFISSIKKNPYTIRKTELINEALHELIEKKHMQPTYFALGGNLVLTKEIIQNVSFDPLVVRGEDMDFIMNAKCFKYDILFNANLTIEHQPPESHTSYWLTLRKSTERFIYEYRKLKTQKKHKGIVIITAQDMGIYPGKLIDNPGPILISANTNLLRYYQNKNMKKEAQEVQKTMDAIPNLLAQEHIFENYYLFNENWKSFMKAIEKVTITLKLRTY